MKITLVSFCLIQLLSASVTAFTVIHCRSVAPRLMTVPLAMSDKPDETQEEEGGLDLDLGEMFEMFDAADKEEDFDKTIKKVKGE